MQQEWLDSWTWTGGAAANFWVPGSPTGWWMWLMLVSSALGMVLLTLVVLFEQADSLQVIVGDGDVPSTVCRPVDSLTPREIVVC